MYPVRSLIVLAVFTSMRGNEMQDEMNDLQMPYTDPNPDDLVRVVRCKDCKYSREHNFFGHIYLQCERPLDVLPVVESEHYCSYGERKERSMYE